MDLPELNGCTKLGFMCLNTLGHNAVTLKRLEPRAFRSQIKHSTTMPLCSHTTRVSNGLDLDQGQHSVGPHLGPNFFVKLYMTADDKCHYWQGKS